MPSCWKVDTMVRGYCWHCHRYQEYSLSIRSGKLSGDEQNEYESDSVKLRR